MDKKKYKRILIAYSLILSTLVLPEFVSSRNYDPNVTLCSNSEAFAQYSNGYVYIGTKEYIESIKDKVNSNDILVIKGMYAEDDSNYKICNSYRITSKEERNEILKILEIYETLNPSDWNRSIESLRNEWSIHNIFYDLEIPLLEERAKHVDLNNNDEIFYKAKVLSLILGN